MNILTGNDLKTGDVVWWDGKGWSRNVNDAVDVGDQAEEIAATEESHRRVNAPYELKAEAIEGGVRPDHIKDRVRAAGPTVRPDLAIAAVDPAAGNWKI